MGVLDAGGKSQIWGVFSAPAASCPDKTHSCCRTSPPRLGLRAFAQAGPLLAICFQPLPLGEMQHKCAGTPTVMPSLTPLLCPPEAHSSLQCLRLAFTHCPTTIYFPVQVTPPHAWLQAPKGKWLCLTHSRTLSVQHSSLAHGRCHRIFVE